MKIRAGLFIFLFFSLFVLSFGQGDKDIKAKDVPPSIKDFLNKNYPGLQDLKYYRKVKASITYIEATFNFNAAQYDLLFTLSGELYEVERSVKFEDISSPVRKNILSDLSKRYTHYKVIETEEVNPEKNLKYELQVKAKKGKHHRFYEVFYDAQGNFLEEEEIMLKSIPSNSGY